MWLDNLKELKKQIGMSAKQRAEKTNLPERTDNRILSWEPANPYIDTLHRIVTALDGSLDTSLPIQSSLSEQKILQPCRKT